MRYIFIIIYLFCTAQRFKSHFPTLLDEKYSPEKFKFEFTSRERTRNTAESFAQGLFGDKCKYFIFPLSFHANECFHRNIDIYILSRQGKYIANCGPIILIIVTFDSNGLFITLGYVGYNVIFTVSCSD